MNLDEYQHATARTDREAPFSESVANHAMGLAGESGELVDALKKLLFHGHEVDADQVRKELGDVLWYVARIAADFGLTLSEVADANIAKLRARYPDGFREADSIARRDAHSPPAARTGSGEGDGGGVGAVVAPAGAQDSGSSGFAVPPHLMDDFLAFCGIGPNGGPRVEHAENALVDMVGGFIVGNQSRFELMGEQGGTVPLRRLAGFLRKTWEGEEYVILPYVWRHEVCAGINPSTVARTLAERGFLVTDSDGRHQTKVRLPGLGRPRCYIVRASIVAESEAE